MCECAICLSMAEHYRVGINLSKLDKTAFTESKSGDKWLNLTLWRNADGVDQYGGLGRVKQDLGMDRKGEDSEIVGNFKAFSTSQNQVSRPAQQPVAKVDYSATEPTEIEDTDIPF